MLPDTGGGILAGLSCHEVQVPGHVELAEDVFEILSTARAHLVAGLSKRRQQGAERDRAVRYRGGL